MAVRPEQARGAGARHQFLREAPVERRQADRIVLHHLGGDAAGAEANDAAKVAWVATPIMRRRP